MLKLYDFEIFQLWRIYLNNIVYTWFVIFRLIINSKEFADVLPEL